MNEIEFQEEKSKIEIQIDFISKQLDDSKELWRSFT